jgi:hypothetical protein
MIRILMNGKEVNKVETKEQAKKYISTCKKIDKKYNAKNTYKMEVA